MKSFKDYVTEAEQSLAEKAVSQQQQKFMGMVHAMQKGKKVKGASPELKKVAHTMGKKDAKDFASTKHKGLPKKVGEQQVNEIDIDALNQLASHPGAGIAASLGGAAIGGAIGGGLKKAADWYTKRKEKKAQEKNGPASSGNAGAMTFEMYDLKTRQSVSKPFKASSLHTAQIKADDYLEGIGKSGQGLAVRQVAGEGINESRMMDEERDTLNHILDRFRHEVKQFEEGGELDDNLYDALYDYYTHSGEMPYGVAKARTGDPYNWIAHQLGQDMGLNAMDEAVRPEEIPAFQRKQAGTDFPVTMGQVQDQSDKISDLATLRKMAGLPYKPPASIPIK